MKTGMNSLQELAREIDRRRAAKEDFVAQAKALSVVPVEGGIHLKMKHPKQGEREFDINNIAHRQLQSYLKIPADYYDRMKAEQPDLLAANVNTWLHTSKDARMIRTMFGAVRAIPSDRYRPLENEQLAEAVLPVITKLDLDIMSAQITDQRLYIKAVDKGVVRELAKAGAKFGDGGHTIVKRPNSPAITISNSEVCMGALSVLVGLYDSFCSNLATFAERSAKKYHVGGRHELGEETYAMLSDKTRQVTDEALWRQIADVTQAAFDRVHFNTLCDKVDATREDKIDGNVVEVVKLAAKKFSLNETEGQSVLKHLIEGGDLSRFGLYNAVTRTAEDLEDYDRASDFERLGGQIIELPKTDWTALAQAA